MRRNRYQKGSLKKRCGKWIGQWREGDTRRNRVLGPLGSMTKSQAKARLDEVLAPLNARPASVSGEIEIKFVDFLRGVYFPFYERKWKRSTAATNANRIEVHLISSFAERKLKKFNRDELQDV